MKVITTETLKKMLYIKGVTVQAVAPMLENVTYNQLRTVLNQSKKKPKRYLEISNKLYLYLSTLPNINTEKIPELDIRELAYQCIEKAKEITELNKERKRRIENNEFENFRIRGRC